MLRLGTKIILFPLFIHKSYLLNVNSYDFNFDFIFLNFFFLLVYHTCTTLYNRIMHNFFLTVGSIIIFPLHF